MRRALLILLLAGLLAGPAPALAAFPGGNGLLAVRPAHGSGLVLVHSDGSQPSQVCVSSANCGTVTTARWSSDGRELALYSMTAQGTFVIYPDGSCLDCQAISGQAPAFTTDPSILTLTTGSGLVQFGIDGVQRTPVNAGPVSDAVWSAQGQLAVVRNGKVFAGSPGHLRSLGRGTDPSWAPSGSRLVLERRGWVTVVRLKKRSAQRLVRGRQPVFSPDGKSIAFTATGFKLSLISSSGGTARRIGHMRGTALDWQPVPAKPATTCAIPPGSTTMTSSDTGTVTVESAPGQEFGYPLPAYLGCLLSTGRVRLLARYDFESVDSDTVASQAAIGGKYAALVDSEQDVHYGGSSWTVTVFDLSTGDQVSNLGGESVTCPDYEYECASELDGLVIDASGFTAAHSTLLMSHDGRATVTEQIQATDSSGLRTLDTSSATMFLQGAPQAMLTGLTLTGDTLTWQHAGMPESAQLH